MLIYNKHGLQQQPFALESTDHHFRGFRTIQGNQHMLWYSTDKKGSIIFLNSATGKKIWEYNLSGHLGRALLSNKRDKLFLLTERELVALDVSATQTELPRVLWQTSIANIDKFRSFREHMVVADDDSAIYAIDDANYSVFHFDCQTGAMRYLYTEHQGKTIQIFGTYIYTEHISTVRLLGTHNSTLYIEIYF